MTGPFQFAVVDPRNGGRLDLHKTRFGQRLIGDGWTAGDMKTAVLRHAHKFGADATAALAIKIMGRHHEPIDPKFYAPIIAQCAYELTSRPHVLSVMGKRIQQRRPYA